MTAHRDSPVSLDNSEAQCVEKGVCFFVAEIRNATELRSQCAGQDLFQGHLSRPLHSVRTFCESSVSI